MQIKIAVLPGDGIGPEVMRAALKTLKHVAEKFQTETQFSENLIGGASFEEFGTPLTEETLKACLEADAVLLGAVGGYEWENLPHHLKPEAALLRLRKELALFTNIRPAKVYNAFIDSSSLKAEVLKGTDFVVFRELTGGIYFGEPRGYDANQGWNTMIYQRYEVERIARRAFEIARQRKKRVTSVDKANVLEVSQFWREVVADVHKAFPDVELTNMYVDNAAMQIVRDPGQFDVIVTSNMFGDILSDIAGMITGSLGMLPSASLGEKHALYEPVHGSAPDIAGQNKANPIAMIASVAMMFAYSFQMTRAAELIERAIEKTLELGYRTADIYQAGNKLVSTDEMTEQIIYNFDVLYHEEGLGVFTL
ncbi:3-isopropylmalate dehydrogenase [Caldithrix abyssi DSM 13497]|uniref:3-isopropylmalate dehydrogenase n=1 Tax=Caldithrix abyssi DSM 13497 TaxID=880073 RepID=H1XQF3_CALAY|nr:3-isopropylmalate dehydrogenase [Caldithrix abyssi]APF19949.1 leuB 3-isopropylmalate dehydrogenase [Caldithrix abyssi DSM 13497]EHO40040.1 3-isopropylmalate dehydrogenase [Caldithrix abyssi DSM 13497]